jgi:site-specific DNA-methyltransferase (adenine-specific)
MRPVTRNKAGVFTAKEVKIAGQVKLQNLWSYTVSGGSMAEDMIAHKHPAIFPESLARDHILSWSNPGDTILDPFAGSFTTAIAAINTNHKYICIERDPTYFEIGRQRIAKHIGELFQTEGM